MRAVLLAGSLLLPVAPAMAEVMDLKEGDVFCIAYDEKSQSCASVQTLKETGEGEYLMLDLSGFAFGPTRLDMTSTWELAIREEQLCIVPGGANIRITPEDSKLAEGWGNLMRYQLGQMIDEGYCFEHQKCGDAWVAVAYVGGERREEISAQFDVFGADDPRAQSVQPRYLNETEMMKLQKETAEACFPEET
jgi:hypothetical protein